MLSGRANSGRSARLWLAATILLSLTGCTVPSQSPAVFGEHQSRQVGSRESRNPGSTTTARKHDLDRDEDAGGHTLRKHVGRTDDQLHERLDHERGISAASTYTDRATAEQALGSALEQAQNHIADWMERSSHPNLVLDYHGDSPIGRTWHRGESGAEPCSDAKVVLRWTAPGEYYVLTSYPECR